MSILVVLNIETDALYTMPLTRLHVAEDVAARQQGLLRHKKMQLEVCGLAGTGVCMQCLYTLNKCSPH